MNLYDVLKRPIVTEKAEQLRESNVYTFEVDKNANKTLVKQAIRKVYGVVPEKINITYIPSRKKRNRMNYGYTSRGKKAYVYLSQKDKIEIYEGV